MTDISEGGNDEHGDGRNACPPAAAARLDSPLLAMGDVAMSAPNVISIQFFPRYKTIAGLPVVQDAARRVLWDDATITLETVSATAYEAASGAEMHALCAALDAHPRERR